MKPSDFIETSVAVQCVEVMRVARCELARFEITATQVCIAKCLWALACEKMKAQPAPVHARDSLRFSKERDKQKENEIGIDLRLQLQIARKIFGSDFADSAFELERSMQGVIEFFYEHDERADISVADPCARIVLFELFNEPARIINADVKLIARAAQKRARELAQFERRFSSEDRQLRATCAIDQAIFQVDPDLCVGSLK